MLKKILIAIGLRKAPPPVRSYLTASTFVGAVPAALFMAWKYRDRIKAFVRRPEPVGQPV